MTLRQSIATVLGFLVAVFGSSASVLAVDELPDYPSLCASLSQAGKSLKNIEIRDFKLTVESLPPGSGAVWAKSDYTIEGNAWYDGEPDSKARIDITKKITEWESSPGSPLKPLELQQDVAYDGQFGRIVNLKSGPAGRMADVPTAIIFPNAPAPLRDRFQAFADGTAYSLNFYKPPSRLDRTLAAMLGVAPFVVEGSVAA